MFITLGTIKTNSKKYLKLLDEFKYNQLKLKKENISLGDVIEIYKNQTSILISINNFQFKSQIYF